eukprot:2502028-Rhodomonas_salina.1
MDTDRLRSPCTGRTSPRPNTCPETTKIRGRIFEQTSPNKEPTHAETQAVQNCKTSARTAIQPSLLATHRWARAAGRGATGARCGISVPRLNTWRAIYHLSTASGAANASGNT